MAIKTIHLPNGEDVVIDEWLHWPQFSTIEMAAGASINLRAFTYVQGQRIPQTPGVPGGSRTATEVDTNQVARTRVNHDEALLAYSITYEHFALSAATLESDTILQAPVPVLLSQNLRRLQRDVVLSLIVGAGQMKPQARAPFSWFEQGPGAVAFSSGDAMAAGLAVSYGTAGTVSPANQRRWNLPVYIASDRVMHLDVRSYPGAITDLTQAVRLRFYLDGLKRRPVA